MPQFSGAILGAPVVMLTFSAEGWVDSCKVYISEGLRAVSPG
jgi:hypothetical protein